MENYLSISAVSSTQELQEVAAIHSEVGSTFPLVIGYQVSSKSIRQGTRNNRQPYASQLGELDDLTRDLGLVSAVHYYTKDLSTLVHDLDRLEKIGVQPGLLQLNTRPLSPETLQLLCLRGYKPIFKVSVSDMKSGGFSIWSGEGVEDASSGSVEPLIEQVRARKDLIAYAMFDPSHGTNLGLELDEKSLAVRFGQVITESKDLSRIGIVYAGGINPANVATVATSLRENLGRHVSIDSESGLRTNDQLDMERVREYLIAHRDATQ